MVKIEALELAAKAAGYGPVVGVDHHGLHISQIGKVWNSMDSDSDAFRLVADLKIPLRFEDFAVIAGQGDTARANFSSEAGQGISVATAMREAITMAAASLEKAKLQKNELDTHEMQKDLDGKILERAATAAGIEFQGRNLHGWLVLQGRGVLNLFTGERIDLWNSFASNVDALELASKMAEKNPAFQAPAEALREWLALDATQGDPFAGTRRAITEAAAGEFVD